MNSNLLTHYIYGLDIGSVPHEVENQLLSRKCYYYTKGYGQLNVLSVTEVKWNIFDNIYFNLEWYRGASQA